MTMNGPVSYTHLDVYKRQEHTSSLEQSITYETTSGEDRVAFYSIPMEIYE